MTFREYVSEKYPGRVSKTSSGGIMGCPWEFARGKSHPYCDNGLTDITCEECWNQEMEEDEPMITMEPRTTKKTKSQLIEEMNELKKELARMEKYRQYEEAANEMYALLESFTNAGFSHDEAFTLMTKAMEMTAKM